MDRNHDVNGEVYSNLSMAMARVDRGSLVSSEVDGEIVLWLVLVAVDDHGLQLGLDVGGQWVLGAPGAAAVRSGEKLPSGWLCILDMSENGFYSALRMSCERYGIPGGVVSAQVPIDEILTLALRSGSGHWTQRATGWLLSRTPSSEQLVLLQEIVNKRWLPQSVRQTAAKIIRRTT